MGHFKATPIFTFILALISMLSPLAIDMYLPSFLDIARDLAVSQEKVQTTLAIFMGGFAIGQLFWGPLADSFGRKPTILAGLLGSALMSYGLTMVKTIDSFYLLRLAQGLFAAAPAVVSGALVRDLFERNEFSKIMSSITMVTLVAPLLAPIAGGYIAKYLHWNAIFHLLMIMGVLSSLLFAWKIPETLDKTNRNSVNFLQILKNYGVLITDKNSLGYILLGGTTFALMFCFLTSGSLVYIGLYDIPAENFGYFFMMNIAVMFTCNFINRNFVTKIGAEKMLRLGLTAQLILALYLSLVATFSLGFWVMAIGIAFIVGTGPIIMGNAVAMVLGNYPKMAGTANAVLGLFRFGIGAVVGALLSQIPLTSERPMLFFMVACAVVGALCYYFLSYGNKKESE